jgi:hypothetical protein
VGLVVASSVWRRRIGVATPHEQAVVAGCLALVGGFLVSLPFIAGRVALAVQLQTSRVLWLVEVLASLYLVWVLAEATPRGGAAGTAAPGRWRAPVLVALLTVASMSRGVYVTWLERPDRAPVRVQVQATAWTEALEWIRTHTPAGAHILADPAHAWKYGVSVRVGAARDVYLEEVKDTAMALYSRRVAMRVLERIGALPSFADASPSQLEQVIERFGIDYVIQERGRAVSASLQPRWTNDRFTIYERRGLSPSFRKPGQARTISGSTDTWIDPRTALVMTQYLSAR